MSYSPDEAQNLLLTKLQLSLREGEGAAHNYRRSRPELTRRTEAACDTRLRPRSLSLSPLFLGTATATGEVQQLPADVDLLDNTLVVGAVGALYSTQLSAPTGRSVRQGYSRQDDGHWMHAFSEILTALQK
jgi:hypothetical protein